MEFTDTHAHVYSEELLTDASECYTRSIDSKVTRVFVPNIDVDSIAPLKHLCNLYPDNYFAMMGLHPCSVKEDYENILTIIFNALNSDPYYAIGEIGMDLYWDKTSFEIQKQAFVIQAKWAIDLGLPVSIHSREATKELISIIKSENLNALRGIFHCFSGDADEGKQLMDMGFYLGIGGVVTYKNSILPQTLFNLGLDKLVLETDAPYLPPVPYRGKRNEPSYIPIIAEKLSQIFSVSLEDIAKITTNNSKEVFGI